MAWTRRRRRTTSRTGQLRSRRGEARARDVYRPRSKNRLNFGLPVREPLSSGFKDAREARIVGHRNARSCSGRLVAFGARASTPRRQPCSLCARLSLSRLLARCKRLLALIELVSPVDELGEGGLLARLKASARVWPYHKGRAHGAPCWSARRWRSRRARRDLSGTPDRRAPPEAREARPWRRRPGRQAANAGLRGAEFRGDQLVLEGL